MPQRFLSERLVHKIIFNIFKVGYIISAEQGVRCYNMPLFLAGLPSYTYSVMKFIGLFLLILGMASIVLGLLEYNSLLISWVDQWGEGIGWGIRVGATALGGILYFVYRHED